MEKMFELLLVSCRNDKELQKRAILLHLLCPEGQEIFDTLRDAGETFAKAFCL